MQAHTTLCIKEACLTYLHRGYLARALTEHPDDPFKSRYAASVLAAHRSSCAILAGVRNAIYLLPRLMPRVFFLWIHAFSAAVSLEHVCQVLESTLIGLYCFGSDDTRDYCDSLAQLESILLIATRAGSGLRYV